MGMTILIVGQLPRGHFKLWHGDPFSYWLAYALALYVQFEDGTPLNNSTIGQVIGASSGLRNMDCADLVDHLRLTKNVYPRYSRVAMCDTSAPAPHTTRGWI